MGQIYVKVGRLNSESKEYPLKDARSIAALLEIAGLRKKDTEIVTVNGEELDENDIEDYKLQDGDRVLLARNVAGGY